MGNNVGNLLNKASIRFRKLIQNDIRKKNLIKTGDMIRSIEADFSENTSTGEIVISIGAIYYYTYLDDGTRYIKSFDITDDVVDSKEFEKLMEETIVDITEIQVTKAFEGLGSKTVKIK